MAQLDLKSGYDPDPQLHKARWQQFSAEIDKTNSILKKLHNLCVAEHTNPRLPDKFSIFQLGWVEGGDVGQENCL